MRTYFLKKFLTTYLIIIFSGMYLLGQVENSTSSSSGSSGDVQCELELSNMAEFMKIDLPEYAYAAWKKLFNHCPDASKNIYISGSKIFQNKITAAKDESRKQELFDTLMLIYDRRIEYFGEEGYVLGRKGMDIIRYNESEYEQAYEAFNKSTDLLGVETDLNVITGLVQTGAVMLKAEKIPASGFLDDYLQAASIVEAKKEAGESPAKLNRVSKMLDGILSNTRITDCEAIQNALADRVYDPDIEPEFLKLSLDLLTVSGCENTEFFSDVNEKLMEVAPDPDLAYQVARFNLKNENFEKAAEYLQKAIDNETDNQQKALYEYQLSVIKLSRLNNPQEAKKLAMEAAEHKPGWGEPYFIAANSIVEGIKNCNLDPFDKQAAFWLAADYAYKAKVVDPGLTTQANELIAQYRSNYPSVEETFFRSLKEGDAFQIGCWINETTTVKTK
jgi:tetratricopeptide (TPR) repeat protein